MSSTILFAYILGGTWCGVGIIFFIIGFFMKRSQKKKERECTAITTGTVADIKIGQRNVSEPSAVPQYYPVFAYSAGGQIYRIVSKIGFDKPKLSIGQSVTIYYDAESPETYYVQEYRFGKNLGSIFLGVGGGCFLVGAVVFLFCMKLG